MLYRGDSLPHAVYSAHVRLRGRTFADHFCGNGLMAKFADGGTSDLIAGMDLLDLVLCHVGYDLGQPEQELADHSPLLSFSEFAETAFRFSDRTRSLDLEECPLEEATHFMWQLDIDLPAPVETGLYKFTYESDSRNCVQHVMQQLVHGFSQEATTGDANGIAKGLMHAIAMVHATNRSQHYAALIDVMTYLNSKNLSNRDRRLVDNTIQRAGRDKEWLLYPMDPMPFGPGFSARFSMNRYLQLFRCYRVRNTS